MGYDSAFAERAFDNQYKKTLKLQANKDAVFQGAIEDLRNNPVSEEEDNSGPQELNEEFLDRFERYAEDASTEDLQRRWSKILAGEIRKPGTFSRKIMRSVDELEADAAILFSKLVSYQLEGVLFISLMSELSFDEMLILTQSGLVVDPGLGHHREFLELTMGDGSKLWGLPFGERGLSIPTNINEYKLDDSVLINIGGKPVVPILVLTELAKALCSIIDSKNYDIAKLYFDKLLPIFGAEKIHFYDIDTQTMQWTRDLSI
ncbi:hypothetical protein GCM10008943_32360 [Paenochrobactrum glaciei]|uniref:DUF2806 domain-containing protein n=2 Tax=Paenochrobactrum glaciei TaxID=486407 RepID=A0ABN1GMS1_9HYPH